jgi:hypothetical protein
MQGSDGALAAEADPGTSQSLEKRGAVVVVLGIAAVKGVAILTKIAIEIGADTIKNLGQWNQVSTLTFMASQHEGHTSDADNFSRPVKPSPRPLPRRCGHATPIITSTQLQSATIRATTFKTQQASRERRQLNSRSACSTLSKLQGRIRLK